MNTVPWYQKMIRLASWIITAFVTIGAVLDAFNNSIRLITPFVTFAGTIITFLTLIVIQVRLQYEPLGWITKDHQKIKITKLNFGILMGAVPILVALWLPIFVTSQSNSPSLPHITSVEGASGALGSSPRLAIGYIDAECDVIGGIWDGDNISDDFENNGSCFEGKGTLYYYRSCNSIGSWIDYIILFDAKGHTSLRQRFNYTCY